MKGRSASAIARSIKDVASRFLCSLCNKVVLSCFFDKVFGRRTPLLPEEGWLRHYDNVAKPPKRRRRGGRSQGMVQNVHSEVFRCERPPRPLHQRRLRDILLMSRPPLLGEEGSGSNRTLVAALAPLSSSD